MNAIVQHQPEPQSEATALIQAIERAAINPAVDVDKMERLFALQERMISRNAEAQFNAAMTAAQQEMTPISADATNPQTHSTYASFAKLDRALRPIYTKHGFALSFDEGDSPKPEHVRVLCYVSHTGGHSRTYHRDMPADGKGAKGGDVMTKTHAAGAAGSYGARYLLKGIFNVAVGEEDKDGNASAIGAAFITEKQAADLQAKAEEVGVNKENFLKFLKVGRLAELPASRFNAAIQALNDKARGVR
jgi:hypothetical protein